MDIHKLTLSPPVILFLLTVPRRCFFCGYASCWCVLCCAAMSVPCSLVVTCRERAGLLAVVFCHFAKCVLVHIRIKSEVGDHNDQCKRTSGCYNELVVAFFSTGGGVKGKKIYTCWLYYLFINLHLFYLWWHIAHRPPVTLQFMALPSNWWFSSWFVLHIQQSSGVLPWQVLFSSVTAKTEWNLHV